MAKVKQQTKQRFWIDLVKVWTLLRFRYFNVTLNGLIGLDSPLMWLIQTILQKIVDQNSSILFQRVAQLVIMFTLIFHIRSSRFGFFSLIIKIIIKNSILYLL